MGDVLLYYQDRIANESYLETAVERRSVINLLRLIGYELRPPTPASADLTLLFKHDAAGTLTIDTGATFQTTAKATDVIDAYVFVGQVTVHTLDGAVGPHVEPGLVIGLHGVAGSAEKGRFCLGHKIRRSETEIEAGPGAENAQEKHPDENLPPVLVQSAHFLKNLTWISISPERRERRSEKKIVGEAKKELFVRPILVECFQCVKWKQALPQIAPKAHPVLYSDLIIWATARKEVSFVEMRELFTYCSSAKP